MINGAGIVGEENWEKIYEVNIKGVHYGILQGFKHMKNGGVVINISSTAGHNGKILVKQSNLLKRLYQITNLFNQISISPSNLC